MDWDTISDVQGNPEIKALFYTEYQREGGHPDFVYWRKTFEALDIEEKTRNELIRTAMDKMMESGHRPARPNTPTGSEIEEIHSLLIDSGINSPAMDDKYQGKDKNHHNNTEVTTTDNRYGHSFMVPSIVYSDPDYREQLNNARTLAEVGEIVEHYHTRKGFSHQLTDNDAEQQRKPSKQLESTTIYQTLPTPRKGRYRKIGISIILISTISILLVSAIFFTNLSQNPIIYPQDTAHPQDWSWSSYNYTLEPSSQYTIVVTANNGYSFDSWRYVTSNHWSSTEINSSQSSLTVSGEVMDLNVYFVPKGQASQSSSASITLIPTTTIQLNLDVRDGTATITSRKAG